MEPVIAWISALIAVAAIAAQDAPEKAWADGLASDDPARRFAAIDAIDARGLDALPTLRRIAEGGDAAAKGRAAALIERAGTRRLLRPTLVALDREAKDFAGAVASLSEQSGFGIELPNGREKQFQGPVPAARNEGPMGFFAAIDGLGAAGGFRLAPGSPYASAPRPGLRATLLPSDGPAAPTSYAGPYRVALARLQRSRRVEQVNPPAEAVVREEFGAGLELVAEPGILIQPNGPPRVVEAIDDRGRDLRAPSLSTASPSPERRDWASEILSSLDYGLPMHLPEDRGARVARLRGFLPILAVTRTDELFSSPIDGLQGRTLIGGGVTMKVNRVDLGVGTGFLEVVIQGEPPPMQVGFAAGPRQATMAALHLAFNPDDHLRIEDADGVAYHVASQGTSPMRADGSAAYRVNLFPTRPAKPPARLRYFGVTGVATEVPFEFVDLPIP